MASGKTDLQPEEAVYELHHPLEAQPIVIPQLGLQSAEKPLDRIGRGRYAQPGVIAPRK